MSDYFGQATLEDWLAEEVFAINEVSTDVVKHFEKWRQPIERNIEAWQESDDGYGNPLSWRGWGRGFDAIPESDLAEFESLCAKFDKEKT